MTASEVIQSIHLENDYVSQDDAKCWITVTMNALNGVATAYQVNRNLFSMTTWLSVPRGEDSNFFIQCDRKLNVLGQYGEEIKDTIDLWTACVPVAITSLNDNEDEEDDGATSKQDEESMTLRNVFIGANRLMSNGHPKQIDASFIKRFLLQEVSQNVPFHDTVSDFNFLCHLHRNHNRYELKRWEITRLGECVRKKNLEQITLFRGVLESSVGVGLRCPICESKGHESGTFTQKSFFNHVREFHARNSQKRGLKLQCPICAADSSKVPHERLKLHPAPLHSHLERCHGFQSVGGRSTMGHTSTCECVVVFVCV